MTQEYLDHLSGNYDKNQVPNFYFTSDGTAFGNVAHAESHAKRIGDNSVKVVPHGGKVEQAVDFEETIGAEVNIEAIAEGNKAQAADVDIKKLKRVQLVELCTTLGIEIPEKATKEQLLVLLENPKQEGTN